jgi:cell volume regulation protein A
MNDPVAFFLLSIAGIFLIGSIGELIFQRTNIPDVIWLILAGILLGPVGGFITRPMLGSIAPYFAALTLVVVLFEGGTALKLQELRRAASRSTLLALSTFLGAIIGITALGAIFGMFSARLHEWFGVARFLPEEWGLLHGLLLATILAGSSSIIIMPAMAAAKVDAKIANLVSLESAVTDALCVVGTAAVVDIMLGAASDGAGPAMVLLKSFGIGAGIGVAAGLIWLLFLRALKDAQHAYPFTLAALLVLYVIIDHSGGSAAFGILAVALILGNAKLIGAAIGLKEEVELNMNVRGFHAQMAFMVKSFFFVFIGAMLGPPWGGVILGALLGVSLLFLRIPAVSLALIGSDVTKTERGLVNVAMPRGMAAGVLATLPVTRGVPGTDDFPVMVFTAVFVTILVFAVGFPLAKNRLSAEKALLAAAQPGEAMDLAAAVDRETTETPPPVTADTAAGETAGEKDASAHPSIPPLTDK